MEAFAWVLLFLVATFVLQFKRAALSVWAISCALLLLLVSFFSHLSVGGLTTLWLIAAIIFTPLLILPLRRALISKSLFKFYKSVMPVMSRTEKEALNAGSVGWEQELFSGMPNWHTLQDMRAVKLTEEEKAFLQGPTEKLCGMISNWQINHIDHEIPQEVWNYLKQEGFFSLIIPKKYGGKEFSALAHSQIITKVAGVSVAVGSTVSVPNSLGPAELLLEYGTTEQKNYYLPRLAKGEEIPCFALTSPVAGSDAGSIEDHGVVVKRIYKGKETTGILLNWNKRYITLAPVATLIGLAFKLYDPEGLLGSQKEIGITCALIPADTTGVEIGRIHYPVCSHFPNGPIKGKDVFIPLDWVIGGKKMVGAGWRMLMECLAAGRAISLPSMVTGGAKRVAYASGAYARIRRQFNTAIGSFGGVQEALARVGGYTYLIESLRLFGVCNIDLGTKSAVASAISKYHTTETARVVLNDAMDIHGGKGICMGPNNYLAQSYIEGPVSITVEGANILTRSMIIFGQGAIRCHPYVLKELSAVNEEDPVRGLKQFDKALFAHLGMIGSNKVRAWSLALTSGYLAEVPHTEFKRYYQHFSRFSAAFSYVADAAMITIGGKLKRKERLSARLGDLLSYLYIGSAVLKHYELEKNEQAKPVVHWVCQDLLYRIQTALHDFLKNMPNRWVRMILRVVVFPLGRRFSKPCDKLSKEVAALLLEPSEFRSNLTKHLYTSQGEHDNAMSYIDSALKVAIDVEPLLKLLQDARRKKLIFAMDFVGEVKAAVDASILSADEGRKLIEYNTLRMKVINVDDFPHDIFKKKLNLNTNQGNVSSTTHTEMM